jgi:hypothetical protein
MKSSCENLHAAEPDGKTSKPFSYLNLLDLSARIEKLASNDFL